MTAPDTNQRKAPSKARPQPISSLAILVVFWSALHGEPRGYPPGKMVFMLFFPMRFSAMISLVICLFVLVFLYTAPAPAQPLQSLYRGDSDQVVARMDGADFSERDLYLYLLIQGAESPDALDRYRRERRPAQRARWEKAIRQSIEDWALDRALAGQAPVWTPQRGSERWHALRMQLHPVQQLVWVDRYVAPKVFIAWEDIVNYYEENMEAFLEPETAWVRYIFVPLNKEGLSPEEQAEEKARKKQEMEKLLDRVLLGELPFDEAARQFSQAHNAKAGGAVAPFRRGTWFPEFEERAFRIKPGLHSKVFEGPDGLYLLWGRERPPRKPLAIEKVAGVIHAKLRLRQMQILASVEQSELFHKVRHMERVNVVSLLSPGDTIFQIGAFQMHKARLWLYYPELLGPAFQPKQATMQPTLQNLLLRELQARFNEQQNWQGDRRLVRAYAMARDHLQAREYLRKILHQNLLLGRQKLAALIQQHPSARQAIPEARIAVLQIRFPSFKKLGAANREERLERIRASLTRWQKHYAETSLPAAIQEGNLPGVAPDIFIPTALLRILTREVSDEDVSITLWQDDMPIANLPEDSRALGKELSRRKEDILNSKQRFLPLVETSSSLTLVYGERPDYTHPVVAAQQPFAFRMALVHWITEQVRDYLKASLLREKRLEILFTEPLKDHQSRWSPGPARPFSAAEPTGQ